MKRNAVVSLLFSIALIFGGSLLNVAIADDGGDTVIIMPFSADQPTTESDVLDSLESQPMDTDGEESTISQKKLPGDISNSQKAKKKATLLVLNQSSDGALVSLDDHQYGSCIMPGHSLKILKVPYGDHTFYAACCGTSTNCHWGPGTVTVNKKKVTIVLND